MNPRRRLWLRKRAAENRRKVVEAEVTTTAKEVVSEELVAEEHPVPLLKETEVTAPKTLKSKVATKNKSGIKKSKTTKKGK